jgi:hypothetical protein
MGKIICQLERCVAINVGELRVEQKKVESITLNLSRRLHQTLLPNNVERRAAGLTEALSKFISHLGAVLN